MAARAYERACWLEPGEPAVGLGCTAALVTDRPRRGDWRKDEGFGGLRLVVVHDAGTG